MIPAHSIVFQRTKDDCTALWNHDRCLSCTHASKFLWIEKEKFLARCASEIVLRAMFDSRVHILAIGLGTVYIHFDDIVHCIKEKSGAEFASSIERDLGACNVVRR